MALQVDPDRQEKARKYSRLERRAWLLRQLVMLAYIAFWLVSGLAFDLLARWSDWPRSVQIAALVTVFGLGGTLVSLPVSWYSGYLLPHRFELSTETPRSWLLDRLKMLLISLPIEIGIFIGIFALLRAVPQTWWLWMGLAWTLVMVVMVNLGPVLIMPLFNKFTPLDDAHPELVERLLTLARRSGTRVRGVYTMDMSRRSRAANAALTGLGNTRRIVIGDTLLNEFEPDEVEAVLAHELGHHLHHDMAVLIALNGLIMMTGFWLAGGLLGWFADRWVVPIHSPGLVPALNLIFLGFELLVMPLTNAITRWRERLADQAALELTGNPQALRNAFIRLANQNLGEIDPEPWVVWLFYDHPPLGERIAFAERHLSGS